MECDSVTADLIAIAVTIQLLTPSTQSISAHLSPVEQICQVLHPQTPASRRDLINRYPKE
ncbi:hypothetical protein [Nostoc sp. DSM 114159]